MKKNHIPSLRIPFLLVLCFLMLTGCHYKGPGFFAPTSSIPSVPQMLDIPQLIYPMNGATDIGKNISFEWNLIPEALTYDFQLRGEGDSYGDANSISMMGLTTNTYDLNLMELYSMSFYHSNFYWRVRASNNTLTSDWSPEFGFTTQEEPVTNYTLTVQLEGNGTVTSNDNQINCGDNCSAEFPENTNVTLMAASDDSWMFTGWSGDIPGDCDNNHKNCTLTMDKDRTVKATFKEAQENLAVPDPTICIEHGETQSKILWAWIFSEALGARYKVTIVITNPDGTQNEEVFTSAKDAVKLLFFYDIFVYGNYHWEITKIENLDTGKTVEFEGGTKGTVEVTSKEQNPGECN